MKKVVITFVFAAAGARSDRIGVEESSFLQDVECDGTGQCDKGGCYQMNAEYPDCDGGYCYQMRAINPTCLKGHCYPGPGFAVFFGVQRNCRVSPAT